MLGKVVAQLQPHFSDLMDKRTVTEVKRYLEHLSMTNLADAQEGEIRREGYGFEREPLRPFNHGALSIVALFIIQDPNAIPVSWRPRFVPVLYGGSHVTKEVKDRNLRDIQRNPYDVSTKLVRDVFTSIQAELQGGRYLFNDKPDDMSEDEADMWNRRIAESLALNLVGYAIAAGSIADVHQRVAESDLPNRRLDYGRVNIADIIIGRAAVYATSEEPDALKNQLTKSALGFNSLAVQAYEASGFSSAPYVTSLIDVRRTVAGTLAERLPGRSDCHG